jgi:hypothetical protein
VVQNHSWPLSKSALAQLYKANLITFDLFETIVYRPTSKQDSFAVYGSFRRRIRLIGEFSWRCLQKLHLVGEFRLDVLRKLLREFIDLEFEYDLKILECRPSMLALIDQLLRRNLNVYVITNTFYTENQIKRICERFGIPESVTVIASSSYGLNKREGLLKAAIGDIPVGHWHFGDDLKQDGLVSEDHFVEMNSPWESALEFGEIMSQKRMRSPELVELRKILLRIVLSNEIMEKDNWFYFGVFFSGPISVYIAEYFLEMKSRSSTQIIFLARDGFLPHTYLKNSGQQNLLYIPYSRAISKKSENLEKLRQEILEIGNYENYIFFDLGWRGESAYKLSKLFSPNATLVLGGRWPWRKRIEDRAIYFPKSLIGLTAALRVRVCPELFELAMTAPHETLLELPAVESDWANENIRQDVGPNLSIVSGARAFQELWLQESESRMTYENSLSPLITLMTRPTVNQLQVLSKIRHTYNDQSVQLLTVGNSPITFWISGSWRWQRINGVSFKNRVTNAGNEVLRRVFFSY